MKNARKLWKGLLLMIVVGTIGFACQDESQDEAVLLDDPIMEVAELSSQLTSGMNLSFAHRGGKPEGATGGRPDGVGGGRPEGASYGGRPSGGGRPNGAGYGGRPSGSGGFGGGQGMRFQQYNDDPNLQVISLADRIGERMNFGMFASMGVDVKHYDENGALVENVERPERGAWRDGNAPKIAQTVIDFGSGFSLEKGNVNLNLSGVITIDRSYADNQLTESFSLQNFKLNDALIEGTKTSVKSFNAETGEGQMATTVAGGKFTFSDGTTADWVSSKSRTISIVIPEEGGRPTSGGGASESETVVTKSDGSIFYSHKTTNPIVMDISCAGNGRGRKPVSGTVEGIYGENTIEIDFGNGECSNAISVTINGEKVSREIGG